MTSNREATRQLLQHSRDATLEPGDFYIRVRDAVERHSAGNVVAWKLDRYGRDEAEAQGLMSWLVRRGIEPESVTEGRIPPIMRSMFLAWAAQESRNTSLRVRSNMRRAAANGFWQGEAPVGYRIIPAPGHENAKGRQPKILAPDPDMAPVVSGLFEVAANTQNRKAILQYANQRGLKTQKTPDGKPVSWRTITRVLENPAYLGQVVYGRTQQSKIDELQSTNGRRPPDQWVVAEDAHEPLTDPETFRRVGDWLAKRKSRPFYQTDNVFMLAGIIYCGRCGGKMYGHKTASKGYTYSGYRCRGTYETYSCDQPVVNAKVVEEALEEHLFDAFLAAISESPETLIAKVEESLVSQRKAFFETFQSRRRQLESRRRDLETMRENLLEVRLFKTFTQEELDRKGLAITAELKAIDRELASMRGTEEQEAEIRAASAWLAKLQADVRRYGPANQLNVTRHNGNWAVEVGPVAGKQALLPLTPEAWQRIAGLLIRRATIDGSMKTGVTINIEWTPDAESILGEPVSHVRLARAVRRTPHCGARS